MLRFRITVSEVPKDDMVVFVFGTCEFQLGHNDPVSVRTFYVYMLIPKGQTSSNVYRTSFFYPKELGIALTKVPEEVTSLSFKVVPLTTPLPSLPLNAFLDDFTPPVKVPENYKFQLYKVKENTEVKAYTDNEKALLSNDSNFIVAPGLLNTHLDP